MFKLHQTILFCDRPLAESAVIYKKIHLRSAEAISNIGAELSSPTNVNIGEELSSFTNNKIFPILIEIKFDGMDECEKFVDKQLEFHKYIYLLSVLIVGNLRMQIPKSEWVYIFNKNNQVSYHLLNTGFSHNGENLSDVEFNRTENSNNSDLIFYPNDDYYNHLWGQNKFLTLPKNVEDFFCKYQNLNSKDKKKFDRACYLYHQGILSEKNHQYEMAMLAFCASIECFYVPNDNQKYSILFSEFINTYGKIPNSLTEYFDKFYNLRSRISHGDIINEIDKSDLFKGEIRQDTFAFSYICKRVLVNWLQAHA